MKFLAHASSSAGNLYTVESGDSVLLIEAGVSIGDIRRHLDFRLSAVSGCLVSHFHGDHASSVGAVMKAGIDVYTSGETWGQLRLNGHRAHAIRAKSVLKIDDWRILPFDTRHDAEGSLGFLIEDLNRNRLLFACDTSFVPYTFAGLTHIAIECNYSLQTIRNSKMEAVQIARVLRHHMGLERVLALLQANDLSRLREVHLLHLSDAHGDSEQFIKEIQEATGVPVYVARK